MSVETVAAPVAAMSWPGRVLDALDRAVVAALLLAVAVMVVVVSAQVALRYGLNRSIDWADEISRLAFVWSIFLGIPLGVRHGSHIGIDLLVDRFPARLRALLKRGGALVCAAMMLLIGWASFIVAREQWGELMATVDYSVGWFTVPVGIGALLSALHLVRIAFVGEPASTLRSAE